ncbi:MAG: Hsp20/alpha crystallin family protein [Saprospiraceae bacterium]
MTYFKWSPGNIPSSYKMNQSCGPKSYANAHNPAVQNQVLVNVLESDTDWTLELAVPGLTKSDIQIGVENNLLKVSAKSEESKESKPTYLRQEFSIGEFDKSFKLPKDADLTNVQATCADGILQIKIAKVEIEKPISTQIPVQ